MPKMVNDMSEATERQSCDMVSTPNQPSVSSCSGPVIILWKLMLFWCPPLSHSGFFL